MICLNEGFKALRSPSTLSLHQHSPAMVQCFSPDCNDYSETTMEKPDKVSLAVVQRVTGRGYHVICDRN